jgi:hypothetical protein
MSILVVKALFLENLLAAGVAGAVYDVVLFNESLGSWFFSFFVIICLCVYFRCVEFSLTFSCCRCQMYFIYS